MGGEDEGSRKKLVASAAQGASGRSQRRQESREAEDWADDTLGGAGEAGGRGGGAVVRGGGEEIRGLPPYPLTNDPSFRSGLSHDLTGFSDFEGPTRALSGGITDPHPASSDPHYVARIAGTGAAAAAAAEATNEAARRAKQEDRGASYKKPKPPGPHGSASVMDRGDTKEERAGGDDTMSDFHISTLEVCLCVFVDNAGGEGGEGGGVSVMGCTIYHMV